MLYSGADIAIEISILLELTMRVVASRSPAREILNPYSLADVAVSLPAPML